MTCDSRHHIHTHATTIHPRARASSHCTSRFRSNAAADYLYVTGSLENRDEPRWCNLLLPSTSDPRSKCCCSYSSSNTRTRTSILVYVARVRFLCSPRTYMVAWVHGFCEHCTSWSIGQQSSSVWNMLRTYVSYPFTHNKKPR